MRPDDATRAVLKDLAAETAFTGTDLAAARAAYDRVFSSWMAGASAPTREDWIDIDASGRPARALSIEPVGCETEGTILFIHGGGWSLGSALCYAPLCRALAAETQRRVIAPDFPQAPEHPFPAAYELLADIVLWAKRTYGPLILAGDSAGGALAAALCSDHRIESAVTAQVLIYPVLDLRPNAFYRSRRKLGGGKYFLAEAGILGAAAGYCGEADPGDPRISPIMTPDPGKLPPTFLLLPDLDPLKDEGEAYAALLRKKGVRVELHRAPKTIHGCLSFSGRIPAGGEGLPAIASFLRDLG